MKRDATYRTQSSTFGPWLLEQIQARGMNRAQFAERMGVSRTTVTRWIDGRVPDASFIDGIADVLVLDYDYVSEKAGYRPRLGDDDLAELHALVDPLLRKVKDNPVQTRALLKQMQNIVDMFESVNPPSSTF